MILQAGRRIGSYLVVFICLLLLSCGGQVDSVGTGTLQINLTDLPSNAYNSVFISVEQIEVIAEDGNTGILTMASPVSFNILNYKDYALRIGESTIPATSYNQLRLVLEKNPGTGDPVNYVTLNCDELPAETDCVPDKKWPLKTPSGHTSGLKILLPNNLEVPNGGIALLTIDFAPETAIVERGDWDPFKHEDKERFLIKPTGIRVVQEGVDTIYGVLFGDVVFADNPAVRPYAVVKAINTATMAPVAAALVTPDEEPGTFRFFLDAGNYDLMVEADGYQPLADGPFAVSESDVEPRPETDAGAFALEPVVAAP